MSHSPVIGPEVQEASNGLESVESPKASDWSGPHGFSPQRLKLSQADDSEHLETLKHTPQCMDACGDKHTHPSDCSPAESHIQHSQRAISPTEDGTHQDTDSCETEQIHKQKLEKSRGEGEERESNDKEVNNLDSAVVKQRKEALISVQPIGVLSSEQPWSNALDEVQPNTSDSPDEAPPLVPAPPPSQAMPPLLPDLDDSPCPAHVMAEVRVRPVPERDRVVRGMQDSKSLDEISGACGGGARGGGARGGQAEGRRATISSALELEGTVSHDGDLTHFITKNLEQKIKMSSRLSLDTDSDSSGPVVRGRSSLRRSADIPPIDPSVLEDLEKHTQDVAQSVELMLRSLNGTIQNMTALSVGYIQTYRDSVDSLGESVDMSIKGMYTLMARCEELDRSMQPIQSLAAQIRDIKRTLDALETIFK
ncbi:hypothetical protein DNTS_033029 [Danionella cerebrum]|uniref:BLOC-1-related complex subunit 6 C-terminal helix domain-containing protein n=1 Tax=Danionella cerebrum TaxID=2873325 RepID=A0A553NN47_9TELE|nr:hypothetical protein DNTS_033029 [Danionella translucida]